MQNISEKKITYNLLGLIFLVAPTILGILERNTISKMLTKGELDGLPIAIYTILMFLLGILFLFYGLGQYLINKKSRISANLAIWALIIGIGGIFIVYFGLMGGENESPMFIAIFPFMGIGIILLFTSLIYLLISVFKKPGQDSNQTI